MFGVDRMPLDPGPSDQNALPISTISERRLGPKDAYSAPSELIERFGSREPQSAVGVDRIPLDPAVVMLALASVICRVGIIQIHFPFLAIVWHGLCRLTRTYEFQCQITQAGRIALAVFCEANNNLSNFNA